MKDAIHHVLDHGFVRLVDHMGDDLSVVRAARVSYDAAWRAGADEGSDYRLINYLMKNRHTSPFEAVQFQFEIKCPIFIARQWHRHRTWAYNEVSARYTALPEEFYVPDPKHIGVQSQDNKQVRDIDLDGGVGDVAKASSEAIQSVCENSFAVYRAMLDAGVPRELVRSVLPVATYTHFFGSVNLHNLLHFLGLRLHSHAQYEIRVYAEAILELITPVVPTTVDAFLEHRGFK